MTNTRDASSPELSATDSGVPLRLLQVRLNHRPVVTRTIRFYRGVRGPFAGGLLLERVDDG